MLTKFKGDIQFKVDGKTYLGSQLLTSKSNEFETVEGFSDYHVTRDALTVEDEKLNIQMNDDDITKLLQIDDKTEVFKINLRKNVFLDSEGKYIYQLSIYVLNKNFVCPCVTAAEDKKVTITEETSTTPYIKVDKNLNLDLKSLYINGEISIIYQLPLNHLKSTLPSIKCDIIDSRNSLKLHESDNLYLYKPSIITEEQIFDRNSVTDEKSNFKDCYKMVFKIPTDYQIPTGLKFEFKD